MSKVISLAQAREERRPHKCGIFVCVGCKHEWDGTAPMDAEWVECPSCQLPKGTHKHPFGAQEGDAVLQCKCGNEALTAYKRKGRFWVKCMGCGTDQTAVFFEG